MILSKEEWCANDQKLLQTVGSEKVPDRLNQNDKQAATGKSGEDRFNQVTQLSHN